MMSEEELERRRTAGTDSMDAAATVKLTRGAIAAKEQKRQSEGWERPDNTILLICVFHYTRVDVVALELCTDTLSPSDELGDRTLFA